MSQPAVAALTSLPFELVYDDGEPLETYWHRLQMNLAIDVIYQAMVERGRSDFFVNGNMFVYYSFEQARDIVMGRRYFRGPDVFFVGGVERKRERKAWVAWEEDGRLPDVIIELLSPSTAEIDRTIKKDLYARTFRTPEYFLYDPDTEKLEGFHLVDGTYQPPGAQYPGSPLERAARAGARSLVWLRQRSRSHLAALLPSRRPLGPNSRRGGGGPRRGRKSAR